MVGGAGNEVGDGERDGGGGVRGDDLGVEGAVAEGLLGLLEIPEDGGEVAAVGGEHRLGIGGGDGVALKGVEVFVGEEGGLRMPSRVMRPKPP